MITHTNEFENLQDLMKQINEEDTRAYITDTDANYGDLLEKLETAFEKYLAKNHHNVITWLQFAKFLFFPPIVNESKTIEVLKQALEYNPLNPYLILMLAYFQSIYGGMSQETIEQIKMVKSDDAEIMSMLELAHAWYYSFQDQKNYEKHLLRSINYCDKHVNNYTAISELYGQQGKYQEAKQLREKALQNVKIITKIEEFDSFDINAFFNYFYKGTSQNASSYKFMKEIYDKICQLAAENNT